MHFVGDQLYYRTLSFLRGVNFRQDYGRLGEILSLLPKEVKVMALTATASKSSRMNIVSSLKMTNPHVISVSPHKKNMVYFARNKPDSIEQFVQSLVAVLKILRTEFPRLLIFCQKHDECSTMYQMLRVYMGRDFTEPPGAPHLAKYRLADMYTKCTHPQVKEDIIESFTTMNGTIRIVVATIAFGMGLDCPSVRQVIHWGPSSDIESFIQETGRGGRDGMLSSSLVLFGKGDMQHVSDSMQSYCTNSKVCRRKLLFHDFDGFSEIKFPCKSCLCCDVCQVKCECGSCAHVRDSFVLL